MKKENNNIEKAVLENCYDCLYFGYGFKHLNYYDLNENKAKQIWSKAINHMSKF